MPIKRILVLCFIAIVFTQCRNSVPKQLTEANLASQFFTIDLSRDTVVTTSKGAIITIPKGAITAEGADRVKLEVKEAYNISDMLLAGLTTKAGNELLSSGGMIYVNPADAKSAKIVQPLAVSLPTNHQQEGMQLYKGERKGDSTIDWTSPQPLPTQEPSPEMASGKVLFNRNCASCHNPLKDATGPKLAFLDQRRDWQWLTHFVNNTSMMIASGDPYSICIFDKFNKTMMTAFPQLTDTQLHLIFKYVDDQCADVDPASIPDFKKSVDSCHDYMYKKNNLEAICRKLVAGNDAEVNVNNMQDLRGLFNSGGNTVTTTNTLPENRVHPAEHQSEYYKFTITEFGWYNVDVIFKNMPGFVNSELTVRVIGEYRNDINIYLVLPNNKILLPGGPVEGKTDEYAFATTDGKIQLPQGAQAFIFAMGEAKSQLYFGRTNFITGLKQTPEIKVITTTRDSMNMQLQKMEMADFMVDMKKSKNADSIRTIDDMMRNLQQIKPQNCDCDCLLPRSDSGSGRIYENR